MHDQPAHTSEVQVVGEADRLHAAALEAEAAAARAAAKAARRKPAPPPESTATEETPS